MAVPTGTFQAHAAIGNREDLTDIISDISPTDTPFMSNVARASATAVFHEWQTDALAAATNQSQVEGDDVATNTASPTTRFGNYSQIQTKRPRVSSTQRAVNTAGRRDEMSYQVAKRLRELKRDMETALCSAAAATSGSASSARTMAGISTWLWDNETAMTASSAATTVVVSSGAPGTAPTDGTADTFEESFLKSCIKDIWDDGGDGECIMLGSFNKQIASGFAGIGTQFRDVQPSPAAPGTIVGAADLYVSDFNTHQIVANRFMPSDQIYVLSMEYWKVAYLQGVEQEPLAKTGLSDQRLISVEFTLEATNPSASGKVVTATTS